MAKTKAISLINSSGGKVELSEVSGFIVENLSADTLAFQLKNQSYTGNPTAGSAEYKRFENSVSNPYGTARGKNQGEQVKSDPIVVNLDVHREIVEEVNEFDLETYGVGNLMARRADDHKLAMSSELDTAFFMAAATEGTAFIPEKSTVDDILEEMILKLEGLKNRYVRGGVKRNLMEMVLNPVLYSAMRKLLQSTSKSNISTTDEEFMIWNGVRFYQSVYLPDGVKAILMTKGAVAQPVVVYPYTAPEKVPMSQEYSVSLFYHYGTKVLSPDTVLVYGTPVLGAAEEDEEGAS